MNIKLDKVAINTQNVQISSAKQSQSVNNSVWGNDVKNAELPSFSSSSNNPVIVEQGGVSNCHFISSMNAILRENPESIKDMVHFDKETNSYKVNFKYKEYGEVKIKTVTVTPDEMRTIEGLKVSPNADAELGIKNSQEHLRAIEYGFLKLHLKDQGIEPKGANGQYTVEQMKDNAEGNAARTMSFLTGKGSVLRIQSDSGLSLADLQPEKIIRGILIERQEIARTPFTKGIPEQFEGKSFSEVMDKHYVFAGTSHKKIKNAPYGRHSSAPLAGEGTLPDGSKFPMPVGHAYVVKSYDQDKNIVVLQDPNFPKKDIQMTEVEFSKAFDSISFVEKDPVITTPKQKQPDKQTVPFGDETVPFGEDPKKEKKEPEILEFGG